jgi:hypothetical protein
MPGHARDDTGQATVGGMMATAKGEKRAIMAIKASKTEL